MKHNVARNILIIIIGFTSICKGQIFHDKLKKTIAGGINKSDTLMTTKKNFKIKGEEIKQLLTKPMGGCIASDKITIDGELVGFMYREEPEFEVDNGWRFLSGNEDQVYADDSKNWEIYDTNTIANYDKAIIPYLEYPVGTELERIKGQNKFKVVKQ